MVKDLEEARVHSKDKCGRHMDGSFEIGAEFDNICFPNKFLLSILPMKKVIKQRSARQSFLSSAIQRLLNRLVNKQSIHGFNNMASLHQVDFPFATVQLVSNGSQTLAHKSYDLIKQPHSNSLIVMNSHLSGGKY